jgi:arginyl-tRNA--protein-N-Asp/Glu arginylyltransferase
MWLIDILGGVPKPHYDYLHGLLYSERKKFDALCHDYNEEIEDYRTAVQEICRRSNNTYYDWCCDQCACDCDKRNGWCNDFEPVSYGK